MAAQIKACCVTEPWPEQPPVTIAQDPPSNNQGNEPEYDFVEQPDQDCFCPVSLGLLTEPYLTSCCGHHISKQVVDRLIRERKPCPMCKEENFTAQVDKFFKRKFINTLKVCCPHKKNECEWVGELGDLNNHSTSCPKRPWKCQYCGHKSTHDVGTNEHTPNCTQYPLPCPNQCEIGTVPRCDAEKHLLMCPLQLVECEFANVGCEVKVPRRDLTRHMTENTQHHLMSATLLNLRLTRELHQKIEEKDKQIAELKQQLNEHEMKMMEQSKEVTKKLEQQRKDLHTKLQQQTKDLDTKRQQQTRDLDTKLQQQTEDLEDKLQQITQAHQDGIASKLSTVEVLLGLTCWEFTLTEFSKRQVNERFGSWYSNSFYSRPGGYRFKLNVDTNGEGNYTTHLSAYLYLLPGDYDEHLQWPLKVTVHLTMINQRGDHSHHECIGSVEYKEPTLNEEYECISSEFFPLAGLTYSAPRNTEYLRQNTIKFKLRLKI